MKMFLICILVILLVTPLMSCAFQPNGSDESNTSATEGTTESQRTETPNLPEKTLDIYLVAGQSNAGGSTSITSVSDILAFAPELENGFSNVHYAGAVPSSNSIRDVKWKKTTYGLGRTSDHIGPEAGMAKAFSVYYNEESGRNAGIIKYAMGGTSLLNSKSTNWVPPSYQKTLSKSEITDATGGLYRNFLKQVEKNVSQVMKYGGYTSVRICGLYWMQGCYNRSNPSEYKKAFTFFASDVRRDVSEIMKKYTCSDNDCGASEMPIIVGTISQTYDLQDSPSYEQTNITFIQMQKSFEKDIPNCYVVDNSAYKVGMWQNGSFVILGSDRYHWNQADALEIGENVGKAMLYCAGVSKEDPFP